jgi:hypothetical protein
LWEQTLVAIGGVAVVNQPARFLLKERVDWITAAARQIATKVCSHLCRNTGLMGVGEACEGAVPVINYGC